MWSYAEPHTGDQIVQAELEKYRSVKEKRLFGRCLQFQYVYTLDAVSPARRYHQRVNEAGPSRIEKAIGGMHGGKGIS